MCMDLELLVSCESLDVGLGTTLGSSGRTMSTCSHCIFSPTNKHVALRLEDKEVGPGHKHEYMS